MSSINQEYARRVKQEKIETRKKEEAEKFGKREFLKMKKNFNLKK